MTNNKFVNLHLPEVSDLVNKPDTLEHDFLHYLSNHLGYFSGCRPYNLYEAIAYTTRDRIMDKWHRTWDSYHDKSVKRAYYLSLEFLIGRSLGNHLLNMDLRSNMDKALMRYSFELEKIEQYEHDAGLGNGGLGRLAACFMDSCATLQLPVTGYGLRYEYGIFRQHIEDGNQVEEPDHWLREGNPWEIKRSEYTQTIHFGGHTEIAHDFNGKTYHSWVNTQDVLAIPYDVPVSGYQNETVNTLRLWRAAATDEFSLEEFNAGDYPEAVEQKNHAESITMVLYPNDSSENGKELRLRQQYFLASASLKDAIRIWQDCDTDGMKGFAEANVFQLNDTHPSIAIAELMRILMDENGIGWDEAWDITRHTMAYTNHTLLPEALEKWPVFLFERLLPRIMEIIYEINSRMLREISLKWPGDQTRMQRMSIIEEGSSPQVRMAHLAIAGSYSVNGVAQLHSELLKEGLFKDFYELWPDIFNNKTNGVTPRRWVGHANPAMTELISEQIGVDWLRDMQQIEQLKTMADISNSDFHERWRAVRKSNKQRLADLVEQECGVIFNADAMFDVQVKRIHEYKRQVLNVLHVIHLYLRIKHGQLDNWTDRCVLIGGKAAPGYLRAKNIIKLINNVAEVINADPDVDGRLKLAFLPNYSVSAMEIIAPGTDLSEQISTAGKEASGTGNMKFMMNGAITIGTYDGANIEILEAAGEDNFFLFGHHVEELMELGRHYQPATLIDADNDLKDVMNLLESGHFNIMEDGIFDDLIASLKSPYDPWFTLVDFRGFVNAQQRAAACYRDIERWTQMSIINAASSGGFSSDRTIEEYNRDIWKLESVQPSEIRPALVEPCTS
ncbi:MAG TPA: glycogen phosphorylase [Gammaproteobacteria bacterium]|nr:glycogen phosphorylase [Gammaproteobacteria bacterium]